MARVQKPPTRLTKAMKIRIITELACMSTPSEVRDIVKAEFGRELKLSLIVYYDPTTAHSELSAEWRRLFEETRTKFLTDCARVPIMHKAYRARQLQKILDLENERKNTVGARETLEQAAKEDGGAYTNKRELSGSLALGIEDIIRDAAGADELGAPARDAPEAEHAGE